MFMLQFLKYAEDMNSQVFTELPTSTVVSDNSLVEETLLVELHLGVNVSETWQHFISLTFSSLKKAFERWPVWSLINFSSTPVLNNVHAHVTQRLWLLFGLKPAYQTLFLPLFEYSISPFIFVLSGLGYCVLNQINLFFRCFCFPKTWQRHISWRMTELRSRDVYAFCFKQWQSSGTCDSAKISDNKGQSLLKNNSKKSNLYSVYDAKIRENFSIVLG